MPPLLKAVDVDGDQLDKFGTSMETPTQLLKPCSSLLQGLLVAILYCFVNKEVRWMCPCVERRLNVIPLPLPHFLPFPSLPSPTAL